MFVLLLVACFAASAFASTTCHGNIMVLHPTGKHGSVTVSQNEVRAHESLLMGLKSCFETVANKYCVQASVICGLASRESNFGASLNAAGYGDNGHAWGILQCDTRTSGQNCLAAGARSCEHIDMMIGHHWLVDFATITRNHAGWTMETRVQATCAAYNFGTKNVQTIAGMDVGTTGGDYSNDVIARAQYCHSHYGLS